MRGNVENHIIEFKELTFGIRVIFEPLMILIFQSCLLPKMRLSVVLEGRYTGYECKKIISWNKRDNLHNMRRVFNALLDFGGFSLKQLLSNYDFDLQRYWCMNLIQKLFNQGHNCDSWTVIVKNCLFYSGKKLGLERKVKKS